MRIADCIWIGAVSIYIIIFGILRSIKVAHSPVFEEAEVIEVAVCSLGVLFGIPVLIICIVAVVRRINEKDETQRIEKSIREDAISNRRELQQSGGIYEEKDNILASMETDRNGNIHDNSDMRNNRLVSSNNI